MKKKKKETFAAKILFIYKQVIITEGGDGGLDGRARKKVVTEEGKKVMQVEGRLKGRSWPFFNFQVRRHLKS